MRRLGPSMTKVRRAAQFLGFVACSYALVRFVTTPASKLGGTLLACAVTAAALGGAYSFAYELWLKPREPKEPESQ
jgi:hypothetical protein